MSTVYIWTPDLPSGYGAFDPDQYQDPEEVEKTEEEYNEED